MQVLLGADPEVFMMQAGKFISAHGMIQGDKEQPFPVKDGAVQVDGMALEFNIDPADSEATFVANIDSVMAQLKDMVPDHEVVVTPVAHFGSEYIQAQPMEARELGCDPDYNAYTERENSPPNEELPFRTGAGHVHIGWTQGMNVRDPMHFSSCISIIKQLDFHLGLVSLLYDDETQRRAMYGAAGAFRPKPYGVEYRTLSNAWLASPELTAWVWRASQAAVSSVMAGSNLSEQYGDIQTIINNSDVASAKLLIEEIGLEVPDVG
jgi:hypothetical protein